VEPAKREGCRNTNRSVAWGATYRYARDPLQAYCMQHWELYHTHAVEEQQQYMFMLGRERKVIGKVKQALYIIGTQTEIEACSTYKAPRVGLHVLCYLGCVYIGRTYMSTGSRSNYETSRRLRWALGRIWSISTQCQHLSLLAVEIRVERLSICKPCRRLHLRTAMTVHGYCPVLLERRPKRSCVPAAASENIQLAPALCMDACRLQGNNTTGS
jgi:hypothetical protein